MCFQILSIIERLLRGEMGFVKGIFSHCIAERNLLEFKVVIEADLRERSCG